MKLVAVSAGLGVPSSSRLLTDRLTSAVEYRAATTPVDVEVIELRDLAVEIAHRFADGDPGRKLAPSLDAVRTADGLIVVTPVFSASYSGLFKSFFDVLDKDALAGKPVLIAATGGTPRHALVLDHALRPLFAHLRAVVVPTGVFAAPEDWHGADLPERIARAADELVLLTGRGSAPKTARPDVGPVPASVGEALPHGFRMLPFEEQVASLESVVARGN